jgi:CHAD domain-containing protein
MGRDMSEQAEYQPRRATHSTTQSVLEHPPVLEHLRKVAGDMREEVDACRRDKPPKVAAVHHLRTGTRRVEAALETLAREAGARGLGELTEKARQRWLRQLKKVRRAAGTVRDLDVHRELLEENFPVASNAGNNGPVDAGGQKPSPITAQAVALNDWLKARRGEAAETLCTTLDGHIGRLLAAEDHFLDLIAKRRSLARRAHRPAAQLALEDYLRLMDAMPLLDNENLHEFRKGAKKARYVAESEEDDAGAQAIAKTVKKVQDAIGEWHDWVVVAEEAREALGNGGAALQAELDRRAQLAFHRALRLTATAGRRLVGEWQAEHRPRRRPSHAAASKTV